MNDGDKEMKSHLQRPNQPPVFSNLHRIATVFLVIVAQDFASCIKLVANVTSAILIRPKTTINRVKLDSRMAAVSALNLLWPLEKESLYLCNLLIPGFSFSFC